MLLATKCSCGKRKAKHANDCKSCGNAKREVLIAKAQAIVATGKCPDCGSPLRRNLALTGWFQCSQHGADGFRADSSKPSCSFQTFTA